MFLFFKIIGFEVRIFAGNNFRIKIVDFRLKNLRIIINLKSKIQNHKLEMSRDTQLKERWEKLVDILSNQFSQGEDLDLDAIIYLIGVQELGKVHREFKKDEKLNLMHIAICRLLEPYGFYEFEYFDDEGWPHYKVREELPPLKAGEQSVLMKEAIVNYFLERELIH
jgi:hypothetical protein